MRRTITTVCRNLFLVAALVVLGPLTETAMARSVLLDLRILAHVVASAPPDALPVPVAGVDPEDLMDSWGAPRSHGRTHAGIDIFAPRGRAIVSTTPGIVATVGHSTRGGRIVRVLGPGRQWHYYAHLDTFGDIRVGTIIGRGTVLGRVGNTGNARGTPPHLHYGIYRFRGGAINPYPLLTVVGRRADAGHRWRASHRHDS